QLEKQFLKSGSAFSVEYLSAGPLYKTNGNNYLISDARSIKGAFSQSAFKHKLNFLTSIYYLQHNVTSVFQFPFFQLNFSIDLRYDIRNGFLLFRYTPVVSSAPNSSQKNKQEMVQFQFSKSYAIFSHSASSMICIYSTSFSNVNTLNTFHISMMLRSDFQQKISITPKFSLNALLSAQSPKENPVKPNYYFLSVTGNLQLGTKLMATVNFNMNGIGDAAYYGAGVAAGWKILKRGKLNIYGDVKLKTGAGQALLPTFYHSSISYSQSF
ncbi:MAG: hypothetical protein WBB36_18555, partial [Chitinophagales bacterium]